MFPLTDPYFHGNDGNFVSHAPITQMFPYCSSHEIAGDCVWRNRWWPTTFHTTTAGDADCWCQKWPAWSAPEGWHCQTLTRLSVPRFNVAGEAIAFLEGATANIGMQERFDSYCKELFHSIQIGVRSSATCTFLALHQEHPGSRLSFLGPVEHLEVFVTLIFFSAKSFRRCRWCDF